MNNTTFVRTILGGVVGLVVGVCLTLVIQQLSKSTQTKPLNGGPGFDNSKHALGIERNLHVKQVTTTLGSLPATEYIDEIGKYSITIPNEWSVSKNLLDQNGMHSSGFVISRVTEDNGLVKKEQSFYIESTPKSFHDYTQTDSAGLTTIHNEFSYTTNGYTTKHIEKVHNGARTIIDFIERPETGFNIAIKRDDTVELLPYFKDILNSIEIAEKRLPDSVLTARQGIISRTDKKIEFATTDYTISLPADWEIENDDYGGTGYDWNLSTPTNTVAFFGQLKNHNGFDLTHTIYVITTDLDNASVMKSYLNFVNDNDDTFRITVQSSSTLFIDKNRVIRSDVNDYIGVGETILFLENIITNRNLVIITRFADETAIMRIIKSIRLR